MEYGLPKNAIINKNIPKSYFYKNGNLNLKEREIFTKNIEKIIWLYSLKPNNINVSSYKDEEKEFTEIEIFKIYLKADSKLQNISEIIMKSIPYPILIEFEYEDKKAFAVERQRINKNDCSKNTIEEILITEIQSDDTNFMEKLNFINFRYTNFFEMYLDLYNTILIKKANNKGIYLDSKEYNISEIMAKVELLQNEINLEQNKIKKETQFNKKVESSLKIKKLQKKLEELKQGEKQ